MIFDILFYIGGTVLQAIALVFKLLLPFSVSNVFYAPITSLIATMGTIGGIVDLPVFFQCLAYLVSFEILWVLFLLAWYVVGVFRSLISVGGASGHN